jgi:ACT domain-containing protein
MPTRYLTALDLRRAGTRDVVIDEGTIVTPQALELARTSGITIRTASGAWTPPAPDRGPGAARSDATLPHLPEPVDDELASATGVVVTVVGRDRAGVLAEITGLLARHGTNIHDISQKRIEGFFHLLLTVEVPPGMAFADLKRDLECLGREDDYVVRVMHERVFRFMHRV